MSICILDTSVLVQALGFMGNPAELAAVAAEFRRLIRAQTTILLPVEVVYEAGNHIAQKAANGALRRQFAQKLTAWALSALNGEAPWVLTQRDEARLRTLMAQFPERVLANDGRGKGVGLVDQALIEEFELQVRRNAQRRIYIWSLDAHLAAYDHQP